MNPRVFIWLAMGLLTLDSISARQTYQPLTVSNTSNLTLIDFFQIQNNTLRTGFETFYTLTNLFVDNLFLPNIPKYQETTEEDSTSARKNPTPINEVILRGFDLSVHNLGDTVATAFKVYPSLFTFVICLILLSVLVSFVGLIVCCYRSFCRRKFNRFDTKFGSIKRRIVSVVLFLFLVVYLPAIVILFFTNQNAFSAVNKIPEVANGTFKQIGRYLEIDAPRFFNKVSTQLESMRGDIPDSFDEILEKSLNRSIEKLNTQDLVSLYNNGLSIQLQKTRDLCSNLIELIDQLDSRAFTESPRDEIVAIDKKVESIQNLINGSISVLSANKSLSLGSFLSESNGGLKTAKTKYVESVDSFLSRSSQDIDASKNQLVRIGAELQKDTNNEIFIQRTDNYKYVYFVKLGLSGLATGLFVFFSLGLAGIFCNRTQNSYSQTCHRGISSNFLLSGVGFFFIFAITMAASSALLAVFGIFARHLVCKPAIDFDHNEAFQVFHKIPKINEIIGDVDLYKLLSECQIFDHSSEFKKHIKSKLVRFVENKKPMIIDNLEGELTQLGKINVTTFLENLRTNLEKINSTMTDLSQIDNQKLENIINLLNQSRDRLDPQSALFVKLDVAMFQQQAVELSKNIQKELSQFASLLKFKLDSLSQPNNFNQDEGSNQNPLSLKTLLNNSVIESFDSLVNRKIDRVFDSSPSCKAISNSYVSIIQTGCYEFLDNFNTFWFTLLIVFLLNIFIASFSIVLADLFRKYYPYEEIMSTEVSNYDKESHDLKTVNDEGLEDMGRLRFYNKSSVENYEMNRYYRPDYRNDYYERRA